MGGNPDLDPETADTLTAGVVLTSPSASRWLDRLQVSLDWYRIEIDDAIVTSAFDFIARCFDPTFNPEFVVSNEWCGMFSVTRKAVTSSTHTRSCATARVCARPGSTCSSTGARYRAGRTGRQLARVPCGFVRAARVAWHAHHRPGRTVPGAISSARRIPEWKSNLGLTYAWQVLTLDAALALYRRHERRRRIEPVFRIPHYDYFDLVHPMTSTRAHSPVCSCASVLKMSPTRIRRSSRVGTGQTPKPRNTTCSAGGTS